MTMRTPLGRVRGLGSARSGTHHWYVERLTALAMVPLYIWFVASIVGGVGADYATMQAWLATPGHMLLLMLVIITSFWHAALALGVVIEDYVHHKAKEVASLIAVKFICFFLTVFSVLAVFKIGLGG